MPESHKEPLESEKRTLLRLESKKPIKTKIGRSNETPEERKRRHYRGWEEKNGESLPGTNEEWRKKEVREAQCVYVTVSENEGEIYFDGQTPAELKTYIKKMKWVNYIGN